MHRRRPESGEATKPNERCAGMRGCGGAAMRDGRAGVGAGRRKRRGRGRMRDEEKLVMMLDDVR